MKNNLSLPVSIVIAGIIIAAAIVYKPGAAKPTAAEPTTNTEPIDYVELAGELGLDTEKFKTCIDTHVHADEVAKDQTDGYAAGVNGTPATFINDRLVSGAQPYEVYKGAIELALKDPQGTVASLQVNADDDTVLGNPSAPVAVVVFGDYECPFCERAFRTSEAQLIKQYVETGKAFMVFRDFPLNNIHPAAQPAAEAAECAGDQGKYWEYHDALFENQERL